MHSSRINRIRDKECIKHLIIPLTYWSQVLMFSVNFSNTQLMKF